MIPRSIGLLRREILAALLILVFACAHKARAQQAPAAGTNESFPVKCDCGGFHLRDGRLTIANGSIRFDASQARDSKYSFDMPAGEVKKIVKPFGFRHCMFGFAFKSGGFRRFIAFDDAGKRTNSAPIVAAVKQAMGNEVAAEEESAPPSPEPATDNLQPASYSGPAQQPSNVTITSVPAGADINVDGKYMGSTPSTMQLPAGEHFISVEAEGMKPWQRTITLNPAGNITLSATLEKP